MDELLLAELPDAHRGKKLLPCPPDLVVAGFARFGRRGDRGLAQSRGLGEGSPAAEALEERQQGDEGVLVQLVLEKGLMAARNSFSDSLTRPKASKSQP